MLAIDAARTSGFRDSLYYFRRNPLAFKLNATQPEKDHLITEGKLGSHLRTRAVTLITVRSAYKLHGAKMVQGMSLVTYSCFDVRAHRECKEGRWVVDDYYEDKSLEEITAKGLKAGDPVGEMVDPRAPKELDVGLDVPAREARERGAGLGMYRAGGPTTLFGGAGFGPFSEGPLNAPKKAYYSREGINEENWMFEAAKRANEASEEWAVTRRKALVALGEAGRGGMPVGVYEPHSSIMFCELSLQCRFVGEATNPTADRADTQPTRARWQQVEDHEGKYSVLGGSKVGKNAWGLARVDQVMNVSTQDPSAVPPRSSFI